MADSTEAKKPADDQQQLTEPTSTTDFGQTTDPDSDPARDGSVAPDSEDLRRRETRMIWEGGPVPEDEA